MNTFVFGFLIAIAAAADIDTDSALWNNFKHNLKKSYNASEEPIRHAIFKSNLQKIEEHNAKFKANQTTYELGVNKFADMTQEEFGKMLGTLSLSNRKHGTILTDVKQAPDSIDWRSLGAVTAVRSQEQCGGCWAFATAAALEGAYFIKNNDSVTFSVQQLLDCTGPSTIYKMAGCIGGQLDGAFLYMKDHGLQKDSDYPFQGSSSFYCKANSAKNFAQIDGYIDVKPNDEETLRNAVGTTGPVSVAISATALQLYKSGIYDYAGCKTEVVNHGVVIVGYGTNAKGVQYWILKNSWDITWGEKGFLYLKRGENVCNVAVQPAYPYLKNDSRNQKVATDFIYIIISILGITKLL